MCLGPGADLIREPNHRPIHDSPPALCLTLIIRQIGPWFCARRRLECHARRNRKQALSAKHSVDGLAIDAEHSRRSDNPALFAERSDLLTVCPGFRLALRWPEYDLFPQPAITGELFRIWLAPDSDVQAMN
jgi:hypothetical protein